MTDLQNALAQIKVRAEKATGGPWEETWKQIPGYDGYEVSDFGNVRSYYLKGNHKRKRAKYPRLLKTVPKKNGGYQTVSLKRDGQAKYQHVSVHRLVMLAFAGPCPEGKEVAHLNGDHSDARFSNLAYATHQENEFHKTLHGTDGAGERNSAAKLQGWQVAEIKYLAEKSIPQGKIAELFDLDHKAVSEILRERNWRHTAARTDVPRLVAAVEAVLEKTTYMTRYAHGQDYWGGVRAASQEILAALNDELTGEDDG